MWLAFSIAFSALIADRYLKYRARHGKTRHHVENKGLAGGRISGHPCIKWVSTAALCIMSAVFIPQLQHENTAGKTSILLVLLGGVSNVFDRLCHHSVTDMIALPHPIKKGKQLVWNIADFMLLGGSLLYILHILQKSGK